MWHYWGLLCEESDEWTFWEDLEVEGASSVRTGPPGDAASVPYKVTFDDDGSMIGITHDWFQGLQGRTGGGTILTLSPPPEGPTMVDAVLPAGDGTTIPVSAPVVSADGTIAPCDETSP